jgi:adenine-specific DNA-methyltransferase
LTNLDQADAFCDALKKAPTAQIAYIVSDDDRRFQSVARGMPANVEAVRLYESYLHNFRFTFGR